MKAEVFTLFRCLGEGSVPSPPPHPPSASTMHFGGVTHAESDDGKADGVEQSGHWTRKENLVASSGTTG